VKNRADGSVMMVAESSPASLWEFVKMVRAPEEPEIHIEDLSVTQGAANGEYKGF
jgi:acylphosphatase